jgi:tetratricopeptide (TPR) repeat protein
LFYDSLSRALRDAGREDEDVACCKKAVELDPKSLAALNNLGVALSTAGQVEEAVACYK